MQPFFLFVSLAHMHARTERINFQKCLLSAVVATLKKMLDVEQPVYIKNIRMRQWFAWQWTWIMHLITKLIILLGSQKNAILVFQNQTKFFLEKGIS